MRLVARLKEWIAYRRDIRLSRRAHRRAGESYDHAEGALSHSPRPPGGGGDGGAAGGL